MRIGGFDLLKSPPGRRKTPGHAEGRLAEMEKILAGM
jgi:hypothetical protein